MTAAFVNKTVTIIILVAAALVLLQSCDDTFFSGRPPDAYSALK